MAGYDSTADTLKHSLRVGALLAPVVADLARRAVEHDLSKLADPELSAYNETVPLLRTTTYGTAEYERHRTAMGDALTHHYAHNRHHPEHHQGGISGMTLVDLIEMLADWRAATERHPDGSLAASLPIQQQRYGISDQLMQILTSTARHLGWLDPS